MSPLLYLLFALLHTFPSGISFFKPESGTLFFHVGAEFIAHFVYVI